jgi:Cys-tRNA(Pro)/Cys-tRNA(Cys) deacylase
MPDVLPAHVLLDELGVPYQPLAFPAGIEKGAANVARALGYSERQMVKTLLFETGDRERVLVMVGGDQKAISGHLKKAIGSRNIKLATVEAIKEVTGYEVGSVPPFHWQPKSLRSFLEFSLMEEEVLGVGAGEWGHEIMIAPAALLRASSAILVNLTDKSLPVFTEA